MIWPYCAAAAMTVTAVVHSLVGERRLIGPTLALGAGVMALPLARQVMRFAWYFTSALMLICAAVVAVPGTPRSLVAVVGAVWLGFGLFDLIYTGGRHIGWPLLSAAGLFALIAAVS